MSGKFTARISSGNAEALQHNLGFRAQKRMRVHLHERAPEEHACKDDEGAIGFTSILQRRFREIPISSFSSKQTLFPNALSLCTLLPILNLLVRRLWIRSTTRNLNPRPDTLNPCLAYIYNQKIFATPTPYL